MTGKPRPLNASGIVLIILLALFFHPHPCHAQVGLSQLDHTVIDAEFSRVLDRLVTVSQNPGNQIHVIDPYTGEGTAVDLPKPPTCVSIGPDGMHAAVGHDGSISYIDLNQPALIKTLPVATSVFDIVLAGNGFAYAFPSTHQWDRISCVDLSTGAESEHTGYSYVYRSRGRLHPDGNSIYSIWNGVTPTHAQKYQLSAGGTAAYLYESRYHDDFPTGENLWISDDGLKIFTQGATVLNLSGDPETDLTYAGLFHQLVTIQHLDHSSSTGRVLAIPGNIYGKAPRDGDVWVYEASFHNPLARVHAPQVTLGGVSYASRCRFVFFNAAADRYFVISQAAADSPSPESCWLFTETAGLEGSEKTITASAGPGGSISPSGPVSVFDGSSAYFAITPNPGYQVQSVKIDGVSAGKRTSYSITDISADHTIDVQFAPGEKPLLMLNHNVIDAEYARRFDKAVTVSSIPRNQLHVYDLAAGTDAPVDLPLPPTCISVSPDGTRAAVGHNGWISYVDLAAPNLLNSFPIPIPVSDLALTDSGLVYALHGFTASEPLQILNLQTGQVTQATGNSGISQDCRLKAHPSQSALYVAQHLYPSSLLKFGLTGDTASYLYSWPYTNEYTTRYNLWFSENGARIFTRAAQVFSASQDRQQDMKYEGYIDGVTLLEHLDSSSASGKIAVIPYAATPTGEIRLYDYASLALTGKIVLPRFENDQNQSVGRFVFFNNAGDKFFVIAKRANESQQLPINHAVAEFPAEGWTAPTIQAVAGPGGTITPAGLTSPAYGENVSYQISTAPGFTLRNVLIDGVPSGKRTSFTFENVTSSHTIRANFTRNPADYFGMDPGNYLNFSIADFTGRPLTFTSKVYLEISPDIYRVENTGDRQSTSWYKKVPEGLGLAQTLSNGTLAVFAPPLLTQKANFAGGETWVSESDVMVQNSLGEIGYGKIKVEATVYPKTLLQTPGGVFEAYPIVYKTSSGQGRDAQTSIWSEWFVPYFGSVRAKDSHETVTLTGFGVVGGVIAAPPPIITGTSLNGREITINGFNFGYRNPANVLAVGGKKVSRIGLWQNKQILGTLPLATPGGEATIYTGYWTSNPFTNF